MTQHRLADNTKVKSRLWVDFINNTAHPREQIGQFRISNRLANKYGMNFYLITEVGPGLFPGETHKLQFNITDGSQIAIMTQSATKVMASPLGTAATVEQSFTVSSGCDLIFMPEPIIAFGASALQSLTVVFLEPGSSAIVTEIIGVVAETIFFASAPTIDATVEIRRGPNHLIIDRVAVQANPLFGALHSWKSVTGGSGCVGSMYFAGLGLDFSRRLIVHLAKLEPSSYEIAALEVTDPDDELVIVRARSSDAASISNFFAALANWLDTSRAPEPDMPPLGLSNLPADHGEQD